MSYTVFVKFGKKRISLDVEPDDSISRLMKKIMEQEGIKPGDQKALELGGQDLTNLEQSCRDYNIQHGTTLTLDIWPEYIKKPIGVIIQMNSDNSQYKYIPTDFSKVLTRSMTIKELKSKIAFFLRQEKDVFCKTYDLYQQSHPLPDSYQFWSPYQSINQCFGKGIVFKLKTQKDNVWYIQHQNKIKKQKFNLWHLVLFVEWKKNTNLIFQFISHRFVKNIWHGLLRMHHYSPIIVSINKVIVSLVNTTLTIVFKFLIRSVTVLNSFQ